MCWSLEEEPWAWEDHMEDFTGSTGLGFKGAAHDIGQQLPFSGQESSCLTCTAPLGACTAAPCSDQGSDFPGVTRFEVAGQGTHPGCV